MSEHTVTVLMDGREEKRLYAPAGALFLQLLKGNGHSLVCCNGKGGCGRCRIRFPDGDAPLLQAVGQGQAVDDRGQHAHLVGVDGVHFLGKAATPDIATAHDHAHLHAHAGKLGDDASDFLHAQGVKGRALGPFGLLRGEGLAAQFEYDALVHAFHSPMLNTLKRGTLARSPNIEVFTSAWSRSARRPRRPGR